MKVYKQIPRWWYYLVLIGAYAIAQASKSDLESIGHNNSDGNNSSELHWEVWHAMVDAHDSRHHLVHLLCPLRNARRYDRFLRVH